MNANLNAGPTWLNLVVKVIVGLAWIGAGGVAAATLLRETSMAADVGAALFLFLVPVAWCLIAAFRMKGMDELHQRVAALGQANGLRYGIMMAGLLLGGQVLSSLFLGDGEVNVSGLMQYAVTLIAVQPAMAFIFGEATSFAQLRAYAKRG